MESPEQFLSGSNNFLRPTLMHVYHHLKDMKKKPQQTGKDMTSIIILAAIASITIKRRAWKLYSATFIVTIVTGSRQS